MSSPDTGLEWRPIPGHPNYEVSNRGDIRHGTHVLRGHINKGGYREVHVDQLVKGAYRFVAAAFIGPVPIGHEVRHLNDIKTDDRVENLAYGTRTDNMRDRVANGRDPNRRKTHCPQGHPYDEANTANRINHGRPVRHCLTCRRDSNRLRMRRHRAAMKEPM